MAIAPLPLLMPPLTPLTTPRLLLRGAGPDDAAALLAYRLRNRDHLQPWEPARPAAFHTLAATRQRLEEQAAQMQRGQALHLMLAPVSDPGTVIGECNFTNIVRGPFQACHLGFSIDAGAQGQGLMHEALTRALAYCFEALRLHRVMANHLPDNLRSARLLARLGFEQEGLARAYLHINGAWADHVLTSLINPAYGDAP
ncbi:MAG: putative ribosomal N-acetyltransferase YdaF [Herbaspirillum frisingense]|uniref:[Ribosomal protein uS5]-alanine N-acetyltransferase n=1 Tax=Herbaspirillum frisingense TaxID=92645 RepID=A0A7V8FWI2_9BURK|nr:MAG: putative ribosomal N-acetyltransferase YdaF [Herbaspirillum frisingense]